MVHTGGAAGKVASFACNWYVGHVEGPHSLVLLLPSHPRPPSCLDADLEALGHGEQEAGNEQAALGPGTADSYIWVPNHGATLSSLPCTFQALWSPTSLPCLVDLG